MFYLTFHILMVRVDTVSRMVQNRDIGLSKTESLLRPKYIKETVMSLDLYKGIVQVEKKCF